MIKVRGEIMIPEKILSILEKYKLDVVIDYIRNILATQTQTLEMVKELTKKIEQLSKDSSNSSKPPSSDGLKKKRGSKRGSSGRKPGGQKGHKGIARKSVGPDEIKETIEHKPIKCGKCGKHLDETDKSEVVDRRQIWEVPEIKPDVYEHVFYKTI